MYRRLQTNKVEYKLTVLILSLPNRLDSFSRLYKELNKQIINKPVQIIYLGDNKSMTVGEKRNMALSIAKGRYVAFIDDDDMITLDYIESLLEAIEMNPEVITFNVEKTTDGKDKKLHKYYLNNGRSCYLSPDRSHYKMLPNHLCAWRKDVISKDFPNKSLSEDHNWAESMSGTYSHVVNIDKTLYYYEYSKQYSETH